MLYVKCKITADHIGYLILFTRHSLNRQTDKIGIYRLAGRLKLQLHKQSLLRQAGKSEY